ncbi:NAD-dependent epimerase/dehydratase family protein [Parafilimonas sp.]|uniref:NAD-dependent epimerase/dehydratase family protein n=1 Tax=Parafilimonas sp. TaxID=1969739 RepID=UPI003F7E92FF
MKILVTGAAGFIGSHMSEKLADMQHEVIGVDNLSSFYPKDLKMLNLQSMQDKVAFIEADLVKHDDYKLLPTDIEYIFHFAAQPGLSEKSGFAEYLSNNVTATYNLIEFSKQLKRLKFFVNISTSSVYGLDATKNETAVPEPVSYYGITKLAAEQLVLAESRKQTLNACSLRLYSVYGPRERPDKLYTKLIRSALTNEPFTLIQGSLQHKRSFSFVGDIINGIAAVIGKEEAVNNEIINIGNSMQYTTQQGIDTVEALTGNAIKFEIIPPRTGDQTTTKAVIDKAARLLYYNPQTSLKEGVQQQLNWFKLNFL